jgi:thiamine kinase-like enzyme
MMVVQAAPKTQPGGVQGALFKFWYHSEGTPVLVKRLPIPNAEKFIIRKMMVLRIMVLYFLLLEITKNEA